MSLKSNLSKIYIDKIKNKLCIFIYFYSIMNITVNNYLFEYFNMIPTCFSDKLSNFNLVFEQEITYIFRKAVFVYQICWNLLKIKMKM